MRLKFKIQHYLAITDRELNFLIVLASLLLVGNLVRLFDGYRLDDYSTTYAQIDSMMAAANAADSSAMMPPVGPPFAAMSAFADGQSTANSTTGAAPSAININEASVVTLVELPGIGPAIAGRIVEYRNQYGRFKRVEDLQEVRGIGPATMERLRSLITI